VIVAEGGSPDKTDEVADIAGCRYLGSSEPLGQRLRAAADSTRTPWLMFLRAGCVPEPGWIAAVERFMDETGRTDSARHAAVFRPTAIGNLSRPGFAELSGLLRVAFGGKAKPEQGLLISKRLYLSLGGHPDGPDGETALLRRVGRRHTVMLSAGIVDQTDS
jgi:hypothetical protein